MLSIVVLTLFNVVVLLAPPPFLVSILELTDIPMAGRWTLLLAAVVNVVFSVAFERWGAPAIALTVGYFMDLHKRQRVRDGKTYKAVEGGMR